MTNLGDDVLEGRLRETLRAVAATPIDPGQMPAILGPSQPHIGRHVMSVLVAAAIVVVFFVPLPHVSLFHSLVTPAKVTAPTRLPVVDLSATPAGWVAVADGDVQISVPPTWGVLYNSGCPTGSPPGEVLVNPVAQPCAPDWGPRNLVWLYLPATLRISYQHRRVINGLSVYGDLGNYFVPSLRLQVSLSGPFAQRILHTLTRSPHAVALASGPASSVPSSWHLVTFAGLGFSVPANWPIARSSGAAFGLGTPCATPGVAFPNNAASLLSYGVTLDTDTHFLPFPACGTETPLNQPPMDGVQVDSGSHVHFGVTPSFSAHCLKLHGLTACPATSPAYSILVVRVTVPGRSKPVYVSIGLAGNGMVARTILYSLRAAAATTTSTSVPNSRPWAQTPLLTEAGTAAPVQLPGTPYAYAVASLSDARSSSPERLVRIDLADGQVTDGPALVSGSFLLAIGQQIAVLSPAHDSAKKGPSGPETLHLVQESSMTLGRVVVVPALSLGYQTTLVNPALANHGLWYQVGSGHEVALVDTLTGSVLRSMRFPSTVMSVATSPDERLIYVTFDGTDPRRAKPPMFAVVVEELDASSLKVLARQYIDGELTALATAVSGGVWVANSGGMQWSEFLYLSPKLSQVVRKPLFPFPSGTVPTLDGVVTQGDSAQVFGRSVFLVGSGGASCDDPSTGSFIAGAPFPELSGGGFESWDPFAAWHGLLYGARVTASGLSTEIVRIQPPKACRA